MRFGAGLRGLTFYPPSIDTSKTMAIEGLVSRTSCRPGFPIDRNCYWRSCEHRFFLPPAPPLLIFFGARP